eukprot:TRINITY_DN28882_c0_g1_i1.p1 TRINITY_DN28882_c0_g1~~TRINITY_DN28882_c0_g1_i1.p1  ORF type:complete len:840 (+),score=108.07 TRINITY_DN28882_c0_g1_i1:110-2629(+)
MATFLDTLVPTSMHGLFGKQTDAHHAAARDAAFQTHSVAAAPAHGAFHGGSEAIHPHHFLDFPKKTVVSVATKSGARAIQVDNNVGFVLGEPICINPGGSTEEWHIVAGFGSILLRAPLKFAHRPGEIVVPIKDMPVPDDHEHDEGHTAVAKPQPKHRVAPKPQKHWHELPYWHMLENNWLQCRETMALELGRIIHEFTGAWSTEQRMIAETKRQEILDKLYKRTNGKLGRRYQQRTRTAQVKDVYQDDIFPAENIIWYSSLDGEPGPECTMPKPARWQRLCEYTEDRPYPTVDFAAGAIMPQGGRIYQGVVENFYLIAALQALSMKPQLIANVFCNFEFCRPDLGLYMLRFFKNGHWEHVDIDDAIPLKKDFSPMTCQGEFYPALSWPILIEKAYAKLHGSYEALGGGGHVEEVLADLTGGCATRYGTADVALDRLWMYLYEMQSMCVFGCNINEAECSKRAVPIERHWACAIWKVAKHDGEPYICVCTAAPFVTVMHMPACHVPSPDGYGPHEGFVWLRMVDFSQLFDTIYECRLVNSDLGPPQLTGIPFTPGWVPQMPWFEQMWKFAGDVHADTAPCFIIDVPAVPNEITMMISQGDHRHEHEQEAGDSYHFGRSVHAPLLLRFYQCSKEVTDVSGGEIYLVHLSAFGHTRDACTAVKVKAPGRYLAMVTIPSKYVCKGLTFRTYSLTPIKITTVTGHRSYISVTPAQPLNAMPYHLAGFMRVDRVQEALPQQFDEAEGRGKAYANPVQEGATTGISQYGGYQAPTLLEQACKTFGIDVGVEAERYKKMHMDAMGRTGGTPFHRTYNGMHVVGNFGGHNANATVLAKESSGDCVIS